MVSNISVVIPTYNRDNYLALALSSIANQTIDDLEIIVVDDGSTDRTYEVVKNFNSERITYIKNNKNKGQNISRNIGLKKATGEYISYLDSDDIFYPYHLEKCVRKLNDLGKEYGGVITGYEDVEGKSIQQSNVYDGKFTLTDISTDMYTNIGGLSTLTFRKSILKDIGYHDECLKNSTDLDFYFQIMKEYDLYGIDEVLCRRFKRKDSVSRNPHKIVDGERLILQKHGHKLTRHNKSRRRYNLAKALAELGCMNEVTKELTKCIVDYPYGKTYYYHLLLSLFGEKIFKKYCLYSRRSN